MQMTINEIVKEIRRELDISQETLARYLNVSYATLNRWENNKAKPSRLAMDKLKDYCIANGIPKRMMSELEKYSHGGRLQVVQANNDQGALQEPGQLL